MAEPRALRLAISGEPVHQVRVIVTGRDARTLENRRLRCARKREQASGVPPARGS